MFSPLNLPPENIPGDVSAPLPAPSPRAEASPPAPDIEDYLDHMCAPLIGVVPYARRRSLRAEWRLHIEALAAAYVELGSDPRQAVAQALNQFGHPRRLGREWARTWRRCESRPGWFSVEPPMCAAFGWFALATLGLALAACLLPRGSTAAQLAFQSWLTVLLGTPVTAGLLTGLLARGRHAMGTFYALAALIPLTLGSIHLLPISDEVADNLRTLTMTQFLIWLPIGCSTAALGGWLRDRWEWAQRSWALE